METNSKRPQRSTIDLWRILVLVAGAFFFTVFAFGRVPSKETHEDIVTTLRAVDINHASLQRDVLQARAGLLKNYDPLLGSVKSLHAAVTRLGDLFKESGVETPSTLAVELSRLSSSIDRDEGLVEDFKTNNALLQNSLSIANQMLTELHEGSPTDLRRPLDLPHDLGNLMMRFATQPSSNLSDTIQAQLDGVLSTPYGGRPDVRAYVLHAKMVLTALPAVDRIIQAIQASHTPDDAQRLQKVYLDAYGNLSIRLSWSRFLLGSIALVLCGYIGWLIYRLRLQTHRLTQQLDLENLIGDINTRFNEIFDDVTVALKDSLAMLAHFFDARSYAFAILDNETGLARTTFGDGDISGFNSLRESFSQQIQNHRKGTQPPWKPFMYENLQQRSLDHFPETSLSAGSVVATEIGTETIGLLFLEHSDIRKKPNRDEVRLLGQALIALSQCLKERQEKEEREKLEERLEHAQRLEALGTLAGGIAHEFNNALGAILGYGEMALQLERNSGKTRKYIQEMVSSGHRAKFITDQILTFSRKRDQVSEPFDVLEAIRDVLPMIKMSISESCVVTLQLDEGISPIVGNPIELQQVVVNLCTNAAQASGEVGEIKVTVTERDETSSIALSHGELMPGSFVVISVEDSGIGIPDGLLPHIFEPFFTTKSKWGGTGLGLAVVHGHVAGMNGRINVQSRLNVGTRFDLYFPVSGLKPIPLRDFLKEKTVPVGAGETVLVAQRDGSLRLLFEEKIAALGYEPVGFSSMSALTDWYSANARRPDLVILDMDLWQVPPDFATIRDQFTGIPTVFVTDRKTGLPDMASSKDLTILKKPVSSINLATTLSKLIGGPKQASAAQPTMDR